MKDVVKKEIVELLDTCIICPIADSPWVSRIHCVLKKGGITVVTNKKDEQVPTRIVTGWRLCIDYHKLNDATAKDNFSLPFMDQMLERLTGNEYFCFLDDFLGYFQLPIDPMDQEKTTFTCSFGTYAYRRMPFGICNAPATFQREEGQDEEDEEDELYRDVNINLGRGIQMGDVHMPQEFEDSHVTLTLINPDGQQQSSSVSSQFVTSMLNPTPDAGIKSIFKMTSQMRMNEAVKVAIQLQPDRLHDEAQAENDEFLKTINENMQKIIKEQVKEQVKVQVSKILPKIEQTVNEQLEVEVRTRSSNSSKTSYAVVADLSEMELKKILIEKMEGNKRRDDDADKDKELSSGSDRGSKRRKEGKEPESASALKEKATRSAGKSTRGSKS
nr:reverse transcriptase domain-containing protein [Tanacetum cinerariifolium]